MPSLRPYQSSAIAAVEREFEKVQTTLLVMATGTGKTVCFTDLCHRRRHLGRAMILADREELIEQAARKVKEATGQAPDIEMAGRWADEDGIHGRSPIVVSSFQTQVSAYEGGKRMDRFAPSDFATIIADEAHGSPAPTRAAVLRHYLKNPNSRLLGVTATPDRADKKAMGILYETVAYTYDILDAIKDGWLVPIHQQSVVVKGLDFSKIKTTAGDLNQGELAKVMEEEEALHKIAAPTIEIAGNKKTLVFSPSVAHAERLTEILNRHRLGCARFVCGDTNKDVRRRAIADFAVGEFQYLVNVGVFTTGFDDPSIEAIVMARPTKSRSLYTQMAGRGTRPLPGVADGIDSAEGRRYAIGMSAKPSVLIVDFVGNSGRHKLVTSTDILGGNHSLEVIERAKKKAAASGGARDVEEMLEEVEEELRQKAKRAQEAERKKREAVLARAQYSAQAVDPFDIMDIPPPRYTPQFAPPPPEAMLMALRREGIPTDGLSNVQGIMLLREINNRRSKKLCNYATAQYLVRHGKDGNVTPAEAHRLIQEIRNSRKAVMA